MRNRCTGLDRGEGAVTWWFHVTKMVVLIRNLQTRTVLNLSTIFDNCNILVDILKIGHLDVNFAFVGKRFIKSLNDRYRQRNVVTDVLAFPNWEVSIGELNELRLFPLSIFWSWFK